MIEIVKKLLSDYSDYIISVAYDNYIHYEIDKINIIIYKNGDNNINININNTNYYIIFDKKEKSNNFNFYTTNRLDKAIILDGIEYNINSFREKQINNLKSITNLIEEYL